MKVCILSNDDPAAFQSSINAFIADKKVIDIKYQSMNLTLKFTNGVLRNQSSWIVRSSSMKNEQIAAVRCKCGRPAHIWHSRDGYLCGCINPDCAISLERSQKSRAESIQKWNAKMKGESHE